MSPIQPARLKPGRAATDLPAPAPERTGGAPPPLVRGLAAEYITGIVVREGRTIVVFNTGKLLTSQEKLALEAAVA